MPINTKPADVAFDIVEDEIQDRRRIQGQQLANDEPADDRDAQGSTQFASFSESGHERKRPEDQAGRDHDRRQIDLRHGGDRQFRTGEGACKGQPDGQQSCCDRTALDQIRPHGLECFNSAAQALDEYEPDPDIAAKISASASFEYSRRDRR